MMAPKLSYAIWPSILETGLAKSARLNRCHPLNCGRFITNWGAFIGLKTLSGLSKPSPAKIRKAMLLIRVNLNKVVICGSINHIVGTGITKFKRVEA